MDDTAVVAEPGYEDCRQRNPEWRVRELDDRVTADLEVSLDARELRGARPTPCRREEAPAIGASPYSGQPALPPRRRWGLGDFLSGFR
jgi:hypothetical protein